LGSFGTTIAQHFLGDVMPEKRTIEKAKKDAREGKSPSTQAGEFVHEARARRQAWSSFGEASYSDWIVEGEESWSKSAAARERKGLEENSNTGGTRHCKGTKSGCSGAVAQKVEGDSQGA
jgi:hypothetical protein